MFFIQSICPSVTVIRFSVVYLNPCVCFTTDVKAAKDPYQVAGYFVLQIVYFKQQIYRGRIPLWDAIV